MTDYRKRQQARLRRAEAVCTELREYLGHAGRPFDPVLDALKEWIRPTRQRRTEK